MLGSAALHLLVLAALLWGASQAAPGDIRAGGPPAPRGGGGGGGGDTVLFIALPPAGSPAAQPDVVQQPAQRTAELPLPRPNVREIPPTAPPLTLPTDLGALAKVEGPTRSRSGGGEGAGAGPGSGGGVGTGEGGGVGAGAGAGTGGEGGDVFPAEPRQLVLPPGDPPASVKGRDYAVTFTLDARGRVRRVDVDPSIPDAGYRKKFLENMREMLFYPARTLEGTPIESQYVIVVTPGG